MLLAERLRTPEERAVVLSVLERVMRVKLDMDAVYAADAARAQTELQHRLGEGPNHEFAVRLCLLDPLSLCSALRSTRVALR